MKQKFKKYKYLLILALVLSMLFLSGCGDKIGGTVTSKSGKEKNLKTGNEDNTKYNGTVSVVELADDAGYKINNVFGKEVIIDSEFVPALGRSVTIDVELINIMAYLTENGKQDIYDNFAIKTAATFYRTVFGSSVQNGDASPLIAADDKGLFNGDLSPMGVVYNTNEQIAVILDAALDGKTPAAGAGDKADTATFGQEVNRLFNLARDIGLVIMLCMWFINLFSSIIQENFSFDTLVKQLLYLILGVLCINNAKELVGGFIKVANEMIKEGSTEFKAIDADKAIYYFTNHVNSAQVRLSLQGGGFLGGAPDTLTFDILPTRQIGGILSMLPAVAAILLCAWQILSTLLLRIMELVVRLTIAPIPIAFAAQRGFTDGTMNYIKETFAIAVQPLITVLMIMALPAIYMVVTSIFNPGMIAIALSFFLLSTMLQHSKEIATGLIK